MGYLDRIYKFGCPNCGTQRVVRPRDTPQYSGSCRQCDADIQLQPLRNLPPVPDMLFLGHDNRDQLRIYPVPPGKGHEPWADPYSIRSFLYQAMQHFGRGKYNCTVING